MPGAQDETGDATRRTFLASERTWLAWVRTGLASSAVSIGIGRIAPAVSDVARWPYAVIGIGYGLLGVALVIYGLVRRRQVEDAIRRDEYAPPDDAALLSFVGVAGLLGVGTAVLVLVG
ncbi:MAG: YidH family protein [Thermoleophilaceae bacterium]|jgi:putative membrane protein